MKILKGCPFTYIFILSFFLTLVSCNGQGTGFEGAEENIGLVETDEQVDNTPVVEDIVISGHSPSGNPVIMTDSSSETFAISLSAGNTGATYNFKLDNVSKQDSTSPFFVLTGSTLSTGDHILKVVITNSVSTDFYQFNIRKNAAPTISAFTPAAVSQNVTCSTGSLNFSVNAADAENDALTFSWLIYGVVNTSEFTTTTNALSSSTTFSPACSLAGTLTISAKVSDGNDSITKSWTVLITNPNVASVDSFSPSTDPLTLLSTAVQTFSVSASGKAPLGYVWKLDDVVISGATNAIYSLDATSLTAGAHTLKAIVSDSDSTDNHTFNIIKNAPPVIASSLPTLTTLKLNYQSTKSFTITATDANSDALTYTWKLDSNSHTQLTQTDNANDSAGLLTANAALLGVHSIEVTVSDGHESVSTSWQITVNRFSSSCNNLTSGQVCTILGRIGLNNTTSTQKRGKIEYTLEDPNHLGNYFASSTESHVVWYYNNTVATITRMGIDIPSYDARIIAGNGASGRSSDGLKNSKFRLYSPRGLAYHTATNSLFIADYSNHRIAQILSDGTGRRVIGQNGSATNNTAHNADGVSARDRNVNGPFDVKIDNNNNIAYVAAYGGHNIQKIDISDADYNNWTGSILLGRKNGAGAITSATSEGATGFTTTSAGSTNPCALALSSDGNTLFYSEWAHRVRVINLTNSDTTYLNGTLSVLANSSKNFIKNTSGLTEGVYTDARVQYPRGIALLEDGAQNIKGLFIGNYYAHRIMFVNNTASDLVIGNETVPSTHGRWVFGTGTWGFNGLSKAGNLTYLHNPNGLSLNTTNDLIASNIGNGRVLKLKTNIDDGEVNLLIYHELRYDLVDSINPNEVVTNRISSLKLHPTNGEMYFADLYNGKIKSFNISTGDVSYVLGLARSGTIDHEQDLPQDVYSNEIAGMTFYKNSLLYADKYISWATFRHCLVRAYNTNASDTDFFGTIVQQGRVSTIAGSTALGCHYVWDSAQSGNQATNVRLMVPESIMVYNDELYIVNEYGHCVMKTQTDGTTTPFLGKCGSAANVDGIFGDSSVRLHYPSEILLDPSGTDGSFFLISRSRNTDSRLKYVNRSAVDVVIAGSTIPAGFIGDVITITGGYSKAIALKDNWICVSSGYYDHGQAGAHNVQCFDRTGATPTSSTFQVGPNNGDYLRAGVQLDNEFEGQASTQIKLFSPYDLEFDTAGNLYISESRGNSIKMVKKWW